MQIRAMHRGKVAQTPAPLRAGPMLPGAAVTAKAVVVEVEAVEAKAVEAKAVEAKAGLAVAGLAVSVVAMLASAPSLAQAPAGAPAQAPAQTLALAPADTPPQTLAQVKLPVVATFSVLADVVERVGGEAVQVATLVDPGGDVHVFQPGPNHVRQLAAARLVVSNGLGFEGWIERLVRSSGYRGPIAVATRGIEPLRHDRKAGVHGNHDGHDSAHFKDPAGAQRDEPVDPHAWQSVPNMKRYVSNITDALCEVEAGSCDVFRRNAANYASRLDELDRDIRSSLAVVAADRRKVITSHGAFAYYAREYGVQFLSPVGVSTDVEPSAASVGRLIRQIRQEKVNAFFVEGLSDPRLIERIRAETGGAEPGRLYSDGLSGAAGPASSYEEMMRYNTRAITAALSAPAATPPARP